LEVELPPNPTSIPPVAILFACNLDPAPAAPAYQESAVGPYRGTLPDAVSATMEETLSRACTVEIAAFDEFSYLLADVEILAQHDHVL
ncbi:arsenical pump-driving ATPase, partial [Planococcus sp. SIMBA_143]